MRSGDLVMEFSGVNRAMEGMRAHQKIQHSRPPEYDAEVFVRFPVEAEKFTVEVAGRMDGLYQYEPPGHPVVDEIKTTARRLDDLEERQPPMHWGQAKVYAYIYAKQNQLDTIGVQLTYYQLETGKIREFKEDFSLEQLEEFFQDLLDRYLRWAETLDNHYRERDESIRALTFPFETYRPGQRRMALDVYHTVKNQGQLIVEAPTGIGKTMAAVFPAVKAMGDGLLEKFFYLTAKTTGRAVAQKALDDLRGGGLKFKSLTLTAKDKICFCPESACNGEECEYARGYYDRINEAVEAIFQRDALTREVMEEEARKYNVCPFECSLEMSLWADAIICDYNYAFDPRVHLRRFFSEEISENKYVFLVDEANNLVDRSREMFSAELFKRPILDLRRRLKTGLPGIYKLLGQINTQLVALKKECEEFGEPMARETYPEELTPPLRKFVQAVERWLGKNQDSPFREELLDAYFQVSWFLKVAEIFGSNYAVCMEIFDRKRDRDKDFRIKLFCMDPSVLLNEAFDRCCAAVFFSATLSPILYFRQVLGCEESAGELILPSPFPRENLCLTVADRISTLYKYRERTKMMVARHIDVLVKQRPGNYMVFFPSYRYMEQVRGIFAAMNPLTPNLEILVQERGMSELAREEFLERFVEGNCGAGVTLVGFAVMGGIFGEGIDLVGDRLNGAVIVGVGLPGISLERELIKGYYDNLQGTGFEFAYVFPGLNRVFQAAGRVIRTPEDRGAVLLIGQRFTSYRYRPLLPVHWHPVQVRDEEQLLEVLEEFHG